VTVQINDVNEAPVLETAMVSVPENSPVGTAVGMALNVSDDDVGQTHSFSITNGNDGTFSIDAATGQLRVADSAGLDHETRASVTLVVRVQDSGTPTLSDTATVTVEVTDVNEAPVFVTSSLSMAVDELSAAGTLMGTLKAKDQDVGQTVSYAITGGTGQSLFELLSASSGQVAVSSGAVLNYEAVQSYTLVVTAADDASPTPAVTTATVTVQINDVNEAPVLADATRTVPENSPVGTAVGDPVEGTDPDTLSSQSLTYSIVSQSVPNAFRVDALTGQLEVRTASLNFEALSTYTVELRVTDSGAGRLTDTANVVIKVTDVNEAPLGASFALSVNENVAVGTVVGVVSTTDPDGDSVIYSLDPSTNTQGLFAVESSTGKLTVQGLIDYEAASSHTLTVRASDGSLVTQLPVTVTVNNRNDPPVMQDQRRAVGELAAVGERVGAALVAEDEDVGDRLLFSMPFPVVDSQNNTVNVFNITADGQLLVAQAGVMDSDLEPTYMFQVRVQDLQGASDIAMVTVEVLQQNRAPSVTPSSEAVDENSPVGTAVGAPVAASDPDGDHITYSITAGNVDGVFAIDSLTGQLFVARAVLDFETRPSYTLTVQVTDDGEGALTGSAQVIVSLRDVNEAPVIADQLRSVLENSPAGTLVGAALVASDVDAGQTLTYSITSGNERGAFSLNATSGQLSVAAGSGGAALNYEEQGTYTLVVRVTDSGASPLWDEATVTVNLGDVNDAPTLADRAITVPENLALGALVGTAVTGSDEDARQKLTYTITGGNCYSRTTVAGSKDYSRLTQAVATAGDVALRLDVTGSSDAYVALVESEGVDLSAGGASGWEIVFEPDGAAGRVEVRDCINCPDATPVASANAAGGAELLVAGESRSLWVWRNATTQQLAVGVGRELGVDTLLTWADGGSLTPRYVALAAGSSSSTKFDSVCYPGAGRAADTVLAIGASDAQLTVSKPVLNYEAQREYSFEVTARDDGTPSLAARAVVTVTLQDVNEVPVFTQRACTEGQSNPDGMVQCVSVAENSAVGTLVGPTVGASDQDAGTVLTFSITSGNVGSAFSIDPSTGQLRVNKAILNHEDTLTNGLYTLGVQVTDNGSPALAATGSVLVTITDVNEAPTMSNQVRSVPENSAVGTLVGDALVASDVDAGAWGELTFSIVASSSDAPVGLFVVDNTTRSHLVVGPLAAQLDYETKSSYTLTVQVSDGGTPPLSTTAVVTVEVTDVNEAPVLQPRSFKVPENSEVNTEVGVPMDAFDVDVGQTILYSIVGGDDEQGVFKIGACSGQVQVAKFALDYETRTRYALLVRATDDGSPRLWDEAWVNVTVTDVNEAPVAADKAFQVDENSPVGTGVGAMVVTDVDHGQSHSWRIVSGNTEGIFDVVAATGEVRVARAVLDFETRADYALVLEVTDSGVPPLSARATASIRVQDVNEAPVFPDATRSVAENSVVNTLVGAPLLASDQDAGQSLTYSIVAGNADGLFKIVGSSGQLSVARAALDHETKATYLLRLRATDNGASPPALWDEANVTVEVTDVNERPSCPGQARSVAENSAVGTELGPVLVWSDVDVGQSHSWRILSGNQRSAFEVEPGTGLVKVLSDVLDYESQASYVLSMRVTDDGFPQLSGECALTVSVTNVNEPPTVTDTLSRSVPESPSSTVGTSVTGGAVVAVDPDVGDVLTYSIVGGSGQGTFGIVNTTGSLFVADPTALNYESVQSLTVDVQVMDTAGNTAHKLLTVSITDVNEAPTLFAANLTVGENSAVGKSIGVLRVTDPDANEVHTFTIVSSTAPGYVSLSSPTSGQLVVGDSRLTDVQKTETLLVRVTDKGGLTSEATVVVHVTNVNDPPVVHDFTFGILENRLPGTVVGQVNATDEEGDPVTFGIITSTPSRGQDIFSMSAGGELTVTAGVTLGTGDLNYEVTRQYVLTVGATDRGLSPGGTQFPSAFKVFVNIEDVNEPPTLAAASMAVAENSAAATAVGNMPGSDPDVVHGDVLTYSMVPVGGTAASAFVIDPSTAAVRVGSGPPVLNFEGTNVFEYDVTVQDMGGNSATSRLTISLTNVNEAPTVQAASFFVAESAAAGTTVGQVVAADADASTTLSYALVSGNVDGAFQMDSATGALRIVSAVLDFENRVAYSLRVRVTDNGIPGNRDASGFLTAEATVTVDVTNVNDVSVTGYTGSTLHSTRGGQVVTLLGTNFGPTALKAAATGAGEPAVTVTYQPAFLAQVNGPSYTAADCRVVRRNTAINCTTVAGVGGSLRWTVRMGGADGSGDAATSSSSVVTSYAPPSIADVTGADALLTQGGEWVVLSGDNLGPNGTFVRVAYGSDPSNLDRVAESCAFVEVHSSVRCQTTAGVGAPLHWRVTVGQQSSAVVTRGAYAPPSIANVTTSAPLLDTAGGDALVVDGSNLGALGTPVMVTYGGAGHDRYRATQCVVSVAHQQIKCLTTHGVGAGHRVVVTVGGQTSAPSDDVLSYSPPELTSVSGLGATEAETAGGEEVLLHGRQLGAAADVGSSLSATYGPSGTEFTATDCSVLVAHSTVRCLTAPGTGTNHSWVVTVDGQASALFAAGTGYAAPIVVFYRGDGVEDADTRGGQVVRIEGRQFGTVARNAIDLVTYQRPDGPLFEAVGCRVTQDHVEVTCNTSAGAGTGLAWSVVIDGQESRNPTTGYGVPVVASIEGAGAANASTDGEDAVALVGENFGPPGEGSFLQSVTYGPTGFEYSAGECEVVSHTRVECKTVPGVGADLHWVVTVERQQSSRSEVTTSYAPPLIRELLPSTAATDSEALLVVNGSDYGLLDRSSLAYVMFGETRLEPTSSTVLARSQHRMTFRLPVGQGTDIPVRVAIDPATGPTVLSEPVLFNYGAPYVDKVVIKESDLPGSGAAFELKVQGVNFGVRHTLLVAPNADPSGALVPPEVDPETGVLVGAQVMTPLSGRDGHQSITTLYEGTRGYVQVVVDDRVSNVKLFENLSPLIDFAALADGSSGETSSLFRTAGGAVLRLEGRYFGDDASLVNVTIGGRQCAGVTLDVRDESGKQAVLTCRVPVGEGRNQKLVVYRAGTPSGDTFVDYMAPEVHHLSHEVVDTEGQTLAIRGDNFGLTPQVALLLVDDTVPGGQRVVECPLLYGNHTFLTCTVPPGQGMGHMVNVLVAEQELSDLPQWRYHAPSVSSISPEEGPTPGLPATVQGRYFGTRKPQVFVGGVEAHVVSASQRELQVVVPPSQGSAQAVSVVQAGQASLASDGVLFSYHSPTVTSLSPGVGGTAGGDVVEVVGTNFGTAPEVLLLPPEDSTPSAYNGEVLSNTSYVKVLNTEHTRLQFVVRPGQGARRRVVVRASDQQSPSSANVLFSYAAPNITSITPGNSSTGGGAWVKLRGSNFGVGGRSVRFLLATIDHGTDAQLPQVQQQGWCGPITRLNDLGGSHTEVDCTVPPGIGRDVDVVMYVEGQVSNPIKFSYNPPELRFVAPNVPDANGEALELFGRNFGGVESEANVTISGVPCLDAQWVPATTSRPDPTIQCRMQRVTAGMKAIELTVALQSVSINASEVLSPECKPGDYGRDGELCLECPRGGQCNGSGADPYALEGWFDIPGLEHCPPERQARRDAGEACVNIVPCEPKEACLQNNTCNRGYEGVRCAKCTRGYYRLGGVCEKCPDQPWLLIVGFVVAAVMLCVAGYILNKKQVHLAFLSIGVDYFQVLAMFARSKVRWPAALLSLFRWMSAFNFNLELTAPECSIPDLSYETKWYFTMGLPLAACSIFLLMHFFKYFQKRCIKGRRNKLHSHVSALVGTALVMFYYIYLYITRTTLDIFNCSPTDPPDGHEYMEAVFVPCWEAGGLQMRLFPWALVALVVYTVGYPSLVANILYRNRNLIREDQVLLAKGVGSTRLTNPRSYDIRKRYAKVYYHFVPQYHYWIMAILLRKFMIAFTALMFRKNPSFQLAMALLVLFVAYTLQVRYLPYMSMADREQVLASLQLSAARDPQGWHAMILNRVKHVETRTVKDARRRRWSGLSGQRKASARERVVRAQDFLYNYNTVEAVLLFCAVLVCLSGIMFESGRFDSDFYAVQRDIITYCVFIVIIFSLLYFCAVFFSEIMTTFSPSTMRKLQRKGSTSKRGDGGRRRLDDDDEDEGDGGAELSQVAVGPGAAAAFGVNPMLLAADSAQAARALAEADPSGWGLDRYRTEYERLRTALSDSQGQNQKLTTEMRELKRRAAMESGGAGGLVGAAAAAARAAGAGAGAGVGAGAGAGARGGRALGRAAPRGKKQFGQVAPRRNVLSQDLTDAAVALRLTSSDLVGPSGGTPPAPASPSREGSGRGALLGAQVRSDAPTTAATVAGPASAALSGSGSEPPEKTPGTILTSAEGVPWQVVRDPKGRIYYVNLQTRQTSWDPPSRSEAASAAASSPAQPLASGGGKAAEEEEE